MTVGRSKRSQRSRAARRRVGFALGALGATLTVAALCVSPALADRSYECQITGSSTPSTTECNGTGNTVPGGAFQSPQALAIDASDNLWVTDAHATETHAESLVDKFNSAGNFILQGDGEGRLSYYTLGIAFRDASSQLYAADTGGGHIWVLNEDASFNTDLLPSAWGRGCCFIHDAIDNSGGAYDGDVYVLSESGTVTRVDGAGTPVDFTSGPAAGSNILTGTDTLAGSFRNPTSITVDSLGNIYVTDYGHNVIDEFAATGALVKEFTGSGVPGTFGPYLRGIAVDPTNGDVLVVDATNNVVDEFENTGAYIGQITGTGPSETTPFGRLSGGIAVDSSGVLYVSDESNKVIDVISSNVILPKISNGAVTNQGQSSGTLNAAVDPNGGGDVTSCRFEYGTTASYSLGSVPCNPDPASSPPGSNFSAPTDVSAEIAGLAPQTIYHYRIVVGNANGSRKGADQTYLPQAVAALTTDPPTEVEPASATLNGSYLGTSEDTHYFYEWGTSTSYGNATATPPGADDGTVAGPTRASLPYGLSGLTPETTYHYRLVASNAVGTSVGGDQQFTTPPAVTNLTTEPASGLAAGHATLNGSFIGVGRDTHYYFEYVDEGDYDASAANPYWAGETSAAPPGADAGEGSGSQTVSDVVSFPSAGARYHFRIVASNAFGTTYGGDQVVTSEPPLLPQIAGTSFSNVGQESAMLEAEVNPGFGATVVRFQYGIATTYGSQTYPTESIGSDGSDHSASTAVTELQPGTTYHFRAVASNLAGTVVGPDRTFTTTGTSSVVIPPEETPPPGKTNPPPPEETGQNCDSLSKAAAKKRREARKLRSEARNASTRSQARQLNQRAARAAKRAAQLRSRSARCRQEGNAS